MVDGDFHDIEILRHVTRMYTGDVSRAMGAALAMEDKATSVGGANHLNWNTGDHLGRGGGWVNSWPVARHGHDGVSIVS